MKALFGALALLIVLAATAMLMGRQIKSASPTVMGSDGAASSAAVGADSRAPEPLQNAPQRVQSDLTRSLEQAAAARKQAEER